MEWGFMIVEEISSQLDPNRLSFSNKWLLLRIAVEEEEGASVSKC